MAVPVSTGRPRTIGNAADADAFPQRHSRESGNPFCPDAKMQMDSRFRGNDGLKASSLLQSSPWPLSGSGETVR